MKLALDGKEYVYPNTGTCGKCGIYWHKLTKYYTCPKCEKDPDYETWDRKEIYDGHLTKFCPAFVGNGECDCGK